jgi:hypothetical protein
LFVSLCCVEFDSDCVPFSGSEGESVSAEESVIFAESDEFTDSFPPAPSCCVEFDPDCVPLLRSEGESVSTEESVVFAESDEFTDSFPPAPVCCVEFPAGADPFIAGELAFESADELSFVALFPAGCVLDELLLVDVVELRPESS